MFDYVLVSSVVYSSQCYSCYYYQLAGVVSGEENCNDGVDDGLLASRRLTTCQNVTQYCVVSKISSIN